MAILKNTRLEVRTDGELVVLQIGNLPEILMEYDTAIQLSTWLRVRGKEAKANAGDISVHWSIAGKLNDILLNGRPY